MLSQDVKKMHTAQKQCLFLENSKEEPGGKLPAESLLGGEAELRGGGGVCQEG